MDTNINQSIETTIKSRVYGHDRGWCFTPKHFMGLGSETGIRKALSRLEAQGFIRRIRQGLYDYPHIHEKLGVIPPSVDGIAKALAQRDKTKIQPTGAYAANILGLSDQVPARVVFMTDGPPKKIKLGKLVIVFRQTTAKNMANAGTLLGLIIQAVKYIKKDYLTEKMALQLKIHLKNIDQKTLEKGIRYAPVWVGQYLMKLHGSLNG